jgi:hypothetical protein
MNTFMPFSVSPCTFFNCTEFEGGSLGKVPKTTPILGNFPYTPLLGSMVHAIYHFQWPKTIEKLTQNRMKAPFQQ